MKKRLSIDGLRLPDTEIGSHTCAKLKVLTPLTKPEWEDLKAACRAWNR